MLKDRIATLALTLATAVLTIAVGCAVAPSGGGSSNANLNDNAGNDGNGNANGNTDNANDNQAGARLVVFTDDAPESTFMTTDVRDVDDEIVQFDNETNAIIWKATGVSYQIGSWPTAGNLLGSAFQVRFGTVNGERRAYFTERTPPTICDIEPFGEFLSISRTSVTVPQE